MPASLHRCPFVRTSLGATAAFAALLAATHAHAQCGVLRLSHADRQIGDELGGDISLSLGGSGPVLAAGVNRDDTTAGADAGSVRFFTYSNSQWGEAAWLTLQPADAQPSDHFGTSLCYRDPYLIVSGYGINQERGGVYIFKRFGSSWTQEAKVVNNGYVEDWWGNAVAISNDWAIMGSAAKDLDLSLAPGIEGVDAGAASIYKRSAAGTWSLVQSLSSSSIGLDAAYDWFGSSVDIRAEAAGDELAVIGVPRGNIPSSSNLGYVRVLRKLANDTWTNSGSVTHLRDPRAIPYDDFGYGVSIDGDRIAVTAPGTDAAAGDAGPGKPAVDNAGCVYIMTMQSGEWVTEQRLFAPDATSGADFGRDVRLSGDHCLVGAGFANRAYLFVRQPSGVWTLKTSYNRSNLDADEGLADGIAVSNDWVAVGDFLSNADGVSFAGSVYFDKLADATFSDGCDGAPVLVAGAHQGCSSLATIDGTTSCGGGGAGYGPDVWAAFVPACSGPVTLATAGSAFDTVLSVHSDCPAPRGSNTLACDDDSGPGTTSQLTFDAVAGQGYLIRVSGYSGASGAITLDIIQAGPANDTCAAPTVVTAGSIYAFNNCSATTTPGLTASCVAYAPSVNDLWFRFDAPAAMGTLRLDTCGSAFDTTLSLYNTVNCPSNANQIACNDDGLANSPCFGGATSYISTSIQGGFSYLIRVAGYQGATQSGPGQLRVAYLPNCRCDWNLSGQLSVQDIFDFLAAYFSGSADFNASGATTVQDIFDFLACYFAGCA